MNGPDRPLPRPTRITEAFWNAAREGRLIIQKCNSCGRLQHYPRAFCLGCLSEDMGWQESGGEGAIYTFTITHRAANEFMKSRLPYAVAMVILDEGVRIMGEVVTADLATLRTGLRVTVRFENASEEISLPRFELIVG